MKTRLDAKMKGFIFTLDAVFALVVAAVGISILLYVGFVNPSLYGSPGAQAQNLLNSMLEAGIQNSSQGSLYIGYLASSYNASTYSWPQFGHDAYLSSSVGSALNAPFLLYNFSTPNTILPSVAVNGGVAVLASGNSIYVLNATTGKLKMTFTPKSGSNVAEPPAILQNIFFYANISNGITAVSMYNGKPIWNFTSGNAVTTPLVLDNNYLAFGTTSGFYLLNPINGALVAYGATNAPTKIPIYVDGQYIAVTNSISGQNHVYSYVATTNAFTNAWNSLLAGSSTTNPIAMNNTVAVGGGSTFYVFDLSGSQMAQSTLPSKITGIAASQNIYYVQTVNSIYGLNMTASTIFRISTMTDNQNSTPSYSSAVLYTLINGNVFQGYSTSNYKTLWNITMPSASPIQAYSNIALAYGNIYVPNGNTLYVFGTYKPLISQSILQLISNMYLNNQSDYSDVLLSNFYNLSNIGIFINNTYAPDLSVATFNSVSNSYIQQAGGFPWMDNALANFTISIWVNSSSGNGIIVDELGNGALRWHNSTIELANGIVWIRAGSAGCSPLGSISSKSWTNIAMTYNGLAYRGYLNGVLANTITATRKVPLPTGSVPMSYTLGFADPNNNCGSGVYFNGSMLNYQIYNTTLNSTRIAQIYHQGAFAVPQTGNMLILNLWWPLNGNSNDFSGLFNLGFPYSIKYAKTFYKPQGFYNAFQISKASTPMFISSNGISKLYNVSVVVWR